MTTLLEAIQIVIEQLYDRPSHAPPAAPFVIGDEGYRRIYGARAVRAEVHSERGGAQVLLRPEGPVLHLAIYYPDALIARLEAHHPASRLSDDNIDAFLSFVEELDHYLLVAHRWQSSRAFSLLELELHANVTKHVVGRHVLRRQGCLDEHHAQWLMYNLFHRSDYVHEIPGVRDRYRDARRLAFRYVMHIMALDPAARLRSLRAWSMASPQAKVSFIEALDRN